MTDAISIIVNILDANWSKAPKPSIEDIATLDKGDGKRVRLQDKDVIRIFETAHNEAQPELLYDFVNEHINLTLDIRTVKSRERLSVLRNEVRRILHGFRKGDNTNIDRIIFKTRTDLSDRSKKLFRYTMQCEVVTFSLTAGSDTTLINPTNNQITGADVFQSLSTRLTELSLLTPTAGQAIVGNGSNWVTQETGDITGVTAGTGLSGGGTSGAVTLNVSGLTVSELAADSIQLSNESFADNDTSLMTSAAIQDKILAEMSGFTTGVDLTGGTGILIQSETNTGSGDYSATIAIDLKDEDNMASNSATHAASQQSIKAYVDSEISSLIDSAPGALNTLNELAAAINDDSSFASTITTSIGTKLAKSSNLSDLANAGTARTNLGLGSLATASSVAFSDIASAAVQTSGESFVDNDTSLMTSAAIQDKIQSFSFLTEPRAVTAGGNTLASGETLAFTAGSNISISESGGAVTITATDTNTQLTTEAVQDIVGAMFSSNTESGITVTYEDGDGTIDLSVANQLTLLDEDNFASNSATSPASQQSIKAYVDNEVSGLIDSAPAALNTLNELAAALGDDASFSTTTATALGNRLRVDVDSQGLNSTQQGNALTNLGITASLAEINILDDGLSASDIPSLATSKITSGTFADGRISASSVQQHISAGSLIDISSGSIAVDLSEATEETVAVADDYFLFLDGGATGATKKEAIADFVASIAGSNLTATNGVLASTDTNTQLSTEQVQDIVGAMFSSNTETNITATYQDADGTIDLVVGAGAGISTTDDVTEGSSNLYFTNERVDDRVNALLTAGSNISLTYDDASNSLTLASTDTNTQLTTEQVQDIVGAMFTSNTETRISATYEDGDGTIDLVVDDMTADTNTQLSTEQVQDIAGPLVATGGTKTFIAVTYDDANNDMDFVVPVKDEDNMASNSDAHLATQQSIKAYVDSEVSGLVDSAPAALNTLNELAAALGDDASFSTTIATSIGTKLAKASNLSDLANAGTARTNLGLGSLATLSSIDISSNTNLAVSSPITLSGDTIGLDDPANLSELDESSSANDDKFLLWDESASAWKYLERESLSDLFDHSNFNTIAVSGQSNVAADSTSDTLTFAAGSNVTITTDASTDTVTFASTDTNTNQLTTFTLTGDSGSNQTIAHGNTLDIAGGGGIATVVGATDTVTVSLDDPENLSELDESSDATDDKILLWDESASSWKYMTLDNLQDSIDTGGGGSVRTVTAGGNTLGSSETLAFTAGTNITITESGGAVTIASADTNTQLSTEQVQDIVGAMFSSNTETRVSATYEDGDGTIDLVVDDMTRRTITAGGNTLADGETLAFTAGSNVTISESGGAVTIASTDTNTQLSTEQVQDIVGAMFTSNTETRISATYEDGDGTIDLVVDDMTADTNTFRTVTAGGNTLGSSETLAFTAGSNITITESGGAVTIASTDTNTQLSLLDEDNFASNSATAAASQQSIKAYVDAEVAGLVDSAPAALNTLNELAAALGDDASFSATTSTALGNRLRVDVSNQGLNSTQQGNALTNLGITASLAEINILDDGLAASDIPSLATSKITSGTLDDARVAESNVTQHLAVGSGGGIGLSGKTFTLDIDGMTDIGAALADADIFAVDDGAGGTNRKATMSRLKTYMQNNLTFTTNTNTNQLTTFTLTGDSGSNQTIAHGNTLDVAGGTGIATVVGATDTVTVSLDDPENLSELNESTDATDDKILLWDESASTWKYMTLDNLQDSIDTTASGGAGEAFKTISVSGQSDVVADAAADTLTFAEGSNVTITTDASSDTITIASTDTNTQLSTEQVQDIVGAMFSSNTETRVSATYEDGDGTIDLVVDDMTRRTITAGGNTLADGETLAFTAGSNVTISESGGAVTIASTDTNTQLSTEQVQDIVGAMFSSNTETRISATYQDGDGTIDLVVDDMTTDTNTNQLTTFTLTGDSGSNQTIAHGNTLDIAGGDGIATVVGATDTVTVGLDIDGMTDIGAALADADLMIVDDGAGGTNRKATMSRLKTYMQNNLTFTTNTNTNQLTTFTLTADSGSNQTIAHGNTLDIAGGTGITTAVGATDTVTVTLDLKDEDNMASNSASHAASQQSIKAYVDAELASLVDSAPSALNTLNELAAALGDDASFSTTTATSLGNRLRVDVSNQGLNSTQQGNALTNLGITASLAEINILDDGLAASDIPSLATSKITSGTFDDARIAESNVTQHLAVGSGGGIGLSGKTFTLDIDGMTDIGAALADADLFAVDDGAGGTNRKATMSRLKTYMQNNLTFTTNTNTNQLTTFTLTGDSGSNQTIAHGNTLDIAGGDGIATVVGATDTVTVGLDIDGMTDIGAALADADLMIVDDGAGGTNRKATMSRLKTYMQNNLTFTTNTDTQLSSEQVQDIAGAMFSSNTETLITATYQDGDGTIDLVVDNDLSNYDNSSSGFITATLTTEQVQDIVGAMFSSNTETRISATYQDGDGTIDLVVDDMTADTNTQLSTEEVQDIVGAMVSGNTETNISVTYDDSGGKLNFASTDTNTTFNAGNGLLLSGTTFSINDPDNLTQIAEADIVAADKLLIWDESASSWKYVTVEDLQDEIDTTGGGGASALGDLSDAVTTATSNIGIGSTALDSLTASSGNYNVALGVNAGTAITTGDNNIAIGYQAGNTISTQSSNTMVGFEAGKSATSAQSTYIGYYAGRNNLSNYNTAVGAEAMITYGDKTAERNVAVGNAALKVIETGDKNVSVGAYSGLAVTTGSDNTFLGYGAGDVVNSGSNNILLGYEAGDNITSGSNNLVIGDFQVDVATGDDQIIIGSGDGGVTWLKGDTNGIKALKIKVKAVSSNTTLTDAQSGSYVYWTAGTLTLPATAESGQQYTIINNTGGSATPSLGTSNAIASGWTAHAAMDDETARTYVSVAANKWIYIG